MHSTHTQSIILVVFLILLGLFVNPFDFWMPTELVYLMLAGLVVISALFVTLIWKEGRGDEREELHRRVADRMGYLAVTTVLVLGIIAGSLQGALDMWLVGALAVAVIVKLLSHMHASQHL